ncbi:SHOCT domain-containing protein [Deinococcus sonorensis]|uniref:SHOCT domain-containing protein n=1 Tax=Deinococcus sonorensis TaxID=309891 RepID=A0ABV8Y4Q1_9DEIO
MDVIINNPPAQTFQTQAVPSYPAGYYAPHDHGGPGFLLPLLLIGGAVLFFRGRGRRHWRERRMMMGAGNGRGWEAQTDASKDDGDWSEKLRRGRDRFFSDGALNIARERYARGEIDAEQYEALRRTLGDPTASAAPERS